MKLLASAIAAANARMWFGECPAFRPQENFDNERFAGKWYEVERDPWFPMEMMTMGWSCTTQNYRSTGSGNLDLYYRAFTWTMGGYGGIGGDTTPCTDDTCTWMVSMKPEGKETTGRSPINILATDYDNWQVMYVCGSMMNDAMNMQWVLISSREQTISEQHKAEAYAAIEERLPGFALGWPWMVETKQGGDCQYDWTLW